MTHEEYLDSYHDLTNRALDELALRMGREDWTPSVDLLTQLRAKQSDMWTQYMAQASAEVAP